MNKYLFFRTDRIGDFLLSSILLNSIKRNDPEAFVSIVCSSKNYDYIKNFHLVDEAILYPENNFFKKINFFFSMFFRKNYCTIVCDSKKRSIYSSILIKSKIKILFSTKIIYNFLFKFFFSKILLDQKAKSKILEIRDVINYLNFNYSDKDLNTIKIKDNKNLYLDKNLKLINNLDFVLLHLDEKWIYKNYIKSYKKIEPNINELNRFLIDIVSICKKNLVITSGINNNNLINGLKSGFESIDKNIYIKKVNSLSIFLFSKTNFFDLQYIISKSTLLISSHGAATHVASSFNVNIIDIIDDSELVFFSKWSSHFRKYKKIFRKNFNLLHKDILKEL